MRRLVAFALLGLVATAVVVLSGAIPLKASSGHWRITAWFLDLAKRRSVATHSIGIRVPPLDDAVLIAKGALHYEAGCRPCHGSPASAPPLTPSRMTPHPPDLQQQASRWAPQELFSIVKHGIKFTGMPAWPAPQRDDEVWAVVAFLRVLPGMDPGEYERLARYGGSQETTEQGAASRRLSLAAVDPAMCERCHGESGQGLGRAAVPRLAGQRTEYLRLALEAYRGSTRHSGIMAPIVASLDAARVHAFADHYGTQVPSSSGTGTLSPAGAEIARSGVPARDVPPCAECHGPGQHEPNAAYPILSGQPADYLFLQLRLFADDRRGGSPYAHIMRTVAGRLRVEEMRQVASYYASLDAASAR